MILLVAMIGAITLTFSKRDNIKRQNYFHQIQRKKPTIYTLNDLTKITKSITRAKIKDLLNELLRTDICSVFYMSDKNVNFTTHDF